MKSNSKNSFWDLKPYWCQPWSIISFGVLLVICSWIFFKNIIVTSLLVIMIIVWWLVFLILAPNFYQEITDKK